MSEFEKQNEELFGMVNQRRSCYPDGPRMVLMTEAQARSLVERAKRVEGAAWDAKYAKVDDNSLDLNKALPYVGIVVTALVSLLLGWMM